MTPSPQQPSANLAEGETPFPGGRSCPFAPEINVMGGSYVTDCACGWHASFSMLHHAEDAVEAHERGENL